MNCKTYACLGTVFAIANIVIAVLGVDAPTLMTVFMELCFVAIFCAIVCAKNEVESNQHKIIRNQSDIKANQSQILNNQSKIIVQTSK